MKIICALTTHVLWYVLRVNKFSDTRKGEHGLHLLLSHWIKKPLNQIPESVENYSRWVNNGTMKAFWVVILKDSGHSTNKLDIRILHSCIDAIDQNSGFGFVGGEQ